MAAHRYWRVLFGIPPTNSQGVISVHSLEMRGSVGGPNLAAGGIAYASSQLYSSDPNFGLPSNAFDADSASEWVSNYVSGFHEDWIAYDFGASSPVEIKELFMVAYGYYNGYNQATQTSGGYIAGPIYATLSYSDDNAKWIDLLPWKGFSNDTGTSMSPSTFSGFVETPINFRSAPLPLLPVGANPAVVSPFTLKLIGPNVRLILVNVGAKSITGTVEIDGNPVIPVGRKVRLYVRSSGQLVSETTSDPVTGHYEFNNLSDEAFYVLSIDDTNNYNIAVRDNIHGLAA